MLVGMTLIIDTHISLQSMRNLMRNFWHLPLSDVSYVVNLPLKHHYSLGFTLSFLVQKGQQKVMTLTVTLP